MSAPERIYIFFAESTGYCRLWTWEKEKADKFAAENGISPVEYVLATPTLADRVTQADADKLGVALDKLQQWLKEMEK